MDIDKIKNIIVKCCTYNEFYNRTGTSKLKAKRIVETYNIDVSHFTPGIGRSTRGKKVTYAKVCKACNTSFNTKYNHQIFCSHKCSNSYEPHNPISTYQKICFKYHRKECIICGENLIVEVHHYDHNHENNNPENLIPLCSTHHRYMHSKRGKHLIEHKVNNYKQQFKSGLIHTGQPILIK